MKVSELKENKGFALWSSILDGQGTPSGAEQYGSNALWSSARNNANNAWYVNVNNGNVNNTNTYNRYRVACAAELPSFISDELLIAEADCYRNKHHSMDATRVHYHLSELLPIQRSLDNGSWQPGTSTRFMVVKPVPREIYASKYADRPVHHYVCTLLCKIAEVAYRSAGNVSHGNRIGHSAQTAAEQIRDNIYKVSEGYTKPCWIAKYDVAGFFMSIDKQKAWEDVCYYYQFYRDKREGDIEKLELIKRIIIHDDTSDCELHCPQKLMDLVPVHKRLSPDKGLAIGKYPNQVTAGIVLAGRDYSVTHETNVRTTRFVDDMADIAGGVEELANAKSVTERELAKQGLKLHPQKVYIQPYQHGMNFCGRVIKRNRIYISNRTVKACKNAIRNPNATPRTIRDTMNSYTGIMCHCYAYNIQKRFAQQVIERFGDSITLEYKPNHIICHLANDGSMAKDYETLIKQYNESSKNHRGRRATRNYHYRRRKRQGSGRPENGAATL